MPCIQKGQADHVPNPKAKKLKLNMLWLLYLVNKQTLADLLLSLCNNQFQRDRCRGTATVGYSAIHSFTTASATWPHSNSMTSLLPRQHYRRWFAISSFIVLDIQAAETCLLVDEHKFLVCTIADFLLEVDQFLNSLVSEGTFCLYQLLSFSSTLVEKPGIDFAVLNTQ